MLKPIFPGYDSYYHIELDPPLDQKPQKLQIEKTTLRPKANLLPVTRKTSVRRAGFLPKFIQPYKLQKVVIKTKWKEMEKLSVPIMVLRNDLEKVSIQPKKI